MKMKDKKAEQKEAKRKHLEQLRKKRKSAENLERSAPALVEKPSILIVCEGKNTEPSYFKQFRLTSATIKAVGEGYNTVTLVNRANQLSQAKNYDQVWCVFDKDSFPTNDFNNAITLALGYGFRVAYSNQAFEYWIMLHFNDHQGGGIKRTDYHDRINELLEPYKLVYDGKDSKLVSEALFELMQAQDEIGRCRRNLAITRAERNYNAFAPHANPANEESSTTVFQLVREIEQYL